MSVLMVTSLGELVIDMHLEEAPEACKNFLKLCKFKYYNNCVFHKVEKHFLAQTGDPTGSGRGGESVFGIMYGSQARTFPSEVSLKLRHDRLGVVGMVSPNASQFYITLRDHIDFLD